MTDLKRIGVDLGGTKIEIILTPQDSIDILFKKRIPTEQTLGYQNILRKIHSLIEEAKAVANSPVSIGIGIPGSISPFTQKIRNANTICLNGEKIQEDLQAMVGQKIHFANDANCLALSESIYGAGKDYDSVIAIILGTGMGGGIVRDSQLVEGFHGNSGEWGHYSFDLNGEDCWCGSKGCMELYLSGTGFGRIYRKISGKEARAQEIIDLSEKGDIDAQKAVDFYLDCFGRSLANMMYIFDPDVFVLGGGMSNFLRLYDDGVKKIQESLSADIQPRVLKSTMGDSSGVYGALLLPERTAVAESQ